MFAPCPPTPSPEQPTDGQLMARERGDDLDKSAHCGERPQYQGTESQHGPWSSSRPSLLENPCCCFTCQTAHSG